MAVFQKPGPEVEAMVAEVMAEYHERLRKAGVRITTQMAHAKIDDRTGEPKGPAVMLHGYPALATIQVTSHKDRVAGLGDARLILDGDRWEELPEDRRRSLLDHELTHLELVEKDGVLTTDDSGRPKLKTRPHDFQAGGFWEVIDRHKESSCEADGYLPIHKGFSQRCFPWG